jgi:hypothetical protein
MIWQMPLSPSAKYATCDRLQLVGGSVGNFGSGSSPSAQCRIHWVGAWRSPATLNYLRA